MGAAALTLILATSVVGSPGTSAVAGACDDAPARAWFVDQDSAVCPGDGSSESPFCSLSEAASAPLQPGHAIRLRSASSPYPAVTLFEVPSGTAEAPIVLEPDCGHQAVLTGSLRLHDVSHWTVRGLVIEEGGAGGSGIGIQANTTDVVGIRIEGNTILQRNSTAISIDGSTGFRNTDTHIAHNVVRGSRPVGIRVARADGAMVVGNHVLGLRCDDGPNHSGIHVTQSSSDTTIAYNRIEDFADDCTDAEYRRAGIRVRMNSVGGVIEGNLIRRIPGNPSAFIVGGVSLHEGATDWIVRNNVIDDVYGCGLCDAVDFGNAIDTQWLHNTVVNTPIGLHVQRGFGTEARGNLLVGRDAPVVVVSEMAVIEHLDHNLYGSTTSVPQLDWRGEVLELSDWTQQCGCDMASIAGDPALPGTSTDYTPGNGSPAIDAGPPSDAPFAGTAPDIGALEAPIATGARLDDGDPRLIHIDFPIIPFGPLSPDEGCGGLSLAYDGVPVVPERCTVHPTPGGGADLRIEAPPSFHPVEVTVEYTGAVLVDAAGIGGLLGAYVRPFTFTVGLEGSESGDTFPEPDLGCACTTHERGSAQTWAVVLWLLRRRRPR